MKGFLLTLEAIFVIFLLPYLFFFLRSFDNKKTLDAIDRRENFELSNDMLQVWIQSDRLKKFGDDKTVFDQDMTYAEKETGKCIFLAGKDIEVCKNISCEKRLYYTNEGIKGVTLCVGS